MHGGREGNWFLASTSAPRWVEGWLERVKGEGWWKGGVDWLWLRFNFLSERHVGKGRPDCENSSQWCFFFSSALYLVPLQFVTDCFILFQRNCPVPAHKYPTAEIQQRLKLYHSIIFQHKLLTFKSIPRWDIHGTRSAITQSSARFSFLILREIYGVFYILSVFSEMCLHPVRACPCVK